MAEDPYCEIEGVVIIGGGGDGGGDDGGGDDGGGDDGGDDSGNDADNPDPGDQTGDCEQFMDCYGGSEDQNNQDPCTQAKAPAENATSNSKTPAFNNAEKEIIKNGQVESAAYLIPSGNGQLIVSDIYTGGPKSVTFPPSSSAIAVMHDHLSSNPPSSGDVYQFILANTTDNGLATSYIINRKSDGTVENIYALVITDPMAVSQFIKDQPPFQAVPGLSPNFPGQMLDDYSSFNGSNEMALSHVLDTYNSGIALLKMDINGDFSKINVLQDNDGGYYESLCQ